VTDDAELQPAVATEFLALADLLAGASDVEWNTPSLCDDGVDPNVTREPLGRAFGG
jgi:hypothetical protein